MPFFAVCSVSLPACARRFEKLFWQTLSFTQQKPGVDQYQNCGREKSYAVLGHSKSWNSSLSGERSA